MNVSTTRRNKNVVLNLFNYDIHGVHGFAMKLTILGYQLSFHERSIGINYSGE